jgi:hypothetical protein
MRRALVRSRRREKAARADGARAAPALPGTQRLARALAYLGPHPRRGEAAWWAKQFGIQTLAFPADWKTHGKAAGFIRNQRMLDEGKPDLVLGFPGGSGTADMCSRAERAGVRVVRVDLG